MQEYLQNLNEEQIKPVLDTEGAVLVIAGAGSGKTRVLTSRIAHLILDKNVSPWNILAITFTNKAADEMKERLLSVVGDVSDMWVCTIHSMCVRILRSSADKIGYNSNFTIYSETDKDKVLKRIISNLENGEVDKYFKTAKNLISSRKNNDLSIDEFFEKNSRMRDIEIYVKIMTKYENELHKSNSMDFDDLLIKTYHLLAEHREILEKFSKRFRYIHIDEFQDTNVVQYNIVKLLSFVNGNIFAVGDDDQSIYGWRGADINNILDFEKDFKGAKTYKLERNYRSTKTILDLANTIIANNTKRKSKVLWTENDKGLKPEFFVAEEESGEAQYTAIQIKRLIERGYKFSDFAVLMRLNALSRSYEQEFMKYGLPCKVFGGFKFFERKEIKDLTAYLRILCNPLDNEAVLRIINVPKRGIGAKSIEALNDYALKTGFSVLDGIYAVDELELNSGAKAKISAFKDLIYNLIIDKETLGLTQLVKNIIDKTDFYDCFPDDDEGREKKANVNEFLNSVEEYEKQNPNAQLSEYLNSITLSSDTDEITDGEYVTLATVHSVKGLEFRCVFICGMDKEIFPIERADSDPDDMEEERRLMYVAITRAKERLFITRSRSRFLYGGRKRTVQSEFLDELAPKLGITTYKQQYDERYQNRYANSSEGYDSFSGYDDYGSRKKSGNEDFDRDNYSTRSNYGGASRSSFGSSGSFGNNSSPTPYKSSFKTPSFGFSGSFNSSRQSIVTDKEKDISKFKAGSKVLHKKFGEGTIVAIKNNGGEEIGDIAFKGIGIKSLVLKLAPIELIE